MANMDHHQMLLSRKAKRRVHCAWNFYFFKNNFLCVNRTCITGFLTSYVHHAHHTPASPAQIKSEKLHNKYTHLPKTCCSNTLVILCVIVKKVICFYRAKKQSLFSCSRRCNGECEGDQSECERDLQQHGVRSRPRV